MTKSETQLTLRESSAFIDALVEHYQARQDKMKNADPETQELDYYDFITKWSQKLDKRFNQALTTLDSELEGIKAPEPDEGEKINRREYAIFRNAYNQALSEAQKLIRGKL